MTIYTIPIMGQSHPKVCIVILHWNNYFGLVECLSSLREITYPNYDIIIVNNGSKTRLYLSTIQGTADHVAAVVETQENLGYARGNNLGIKEALRRGTDYILLLNDDTVVSPEFLDTLVNAAERHHDVGILGPKIYHYDEPERIWFVGARFDGHLCRVSFPGAGQIDNGQFEKPREADFITGCAMLVKREVIERIGTLDGRFFLYWEDVDFGVRAKKADIRSLVVPASKIWHKVSSSSGGADSPLKAYHKTRSHLLMAKLHSKGAIPKILRETFSDVLWLLFKSSDANRIKKARAYTRAVLDFYLGRLNKGPRWLWVELEG